MLYPGAIHFQDKNKLNTLHKLWGRSQLTEIGGYDIALVNVVNIIDIVNTVDMMNDLPRNRHEKVVEIPVIVSLSGLVSLSALAFHSRSELLHES